MNVLPFRYLQRLPAREIISKLPIEVTVNKEPRFKVVSLDSQDKTTVSIDDSQDKQNLPTIDGKEVPWEEVTDTIEGKMYAVPKLGKKKGGAK